MTVLVIFYATCCVSHPSQMVTQTKKSRNYGRNELNHEIISISSSPCDWSFWERIHFRFFGVASGERDNKYTGITLMFELSVVLPARKSQDSCLSWHKTGHYTTLRLKQNTSVRSIYHNYVNTLCPKQGAVLANRWPETKSLIISSRRCF